MLFLLLSSMSFTKIVFSVFKINWQFISFIIWDLYVGGNFDSEN